MGVPSLTQKELMSLTFHEYTTEQENLHQHNFGLVVEEVVVEEAVVEA